MIKLNLLPAYVLEKGRIRNTIIVFVVLIALEVGVVFKVMTDLQAQEKWFVADKPYYTDRVAIIAAEKADAAAIASKSGVYDPYVQFFSRRDIQAYNDGIAKVMTEAANTVGGTSAWFDNLTIEDNKIQCNGQITGLMNFVNYYFRMKDTGLTVAPAAKPATSPYAPTMNQTVELDISGSLKTSMPKAPAAPAGETLPDKLYAPYSATPAAGEAGAAGDPSAGGAPGPGGTPGAMPGGTPGGAPGAMPGGTPGGAPGAMPGGAPAGR